MKFSVQAHPSLVPFKEHFPGWRSRCYYNKGKYETTAKKQLSHRVHRENEREKLKKLVMGRNK
jgi:hypothetical protein